MIPENLKDLVSSSEGTGLYQTVAMLLFILFFIGLVIYVFSRPKKYYQHVAEEPLKDDLTDENLDH